MPPLILPQTYLIFCLIVGTPQSVTHSVTSDDGSLRGGNVSQARFSSRAAVPRPRDNSTPFTPDDDDDGNFDGMVINAGSAR